MNHLKYTFMEPSQKTFFKKVKSIEEMVIYSC